MALWADLLRDIHMNEAVAGGFYMVAAMVLGLPLRFIARLLESVPASWLTRESTTGIVTFGAWFLCWLTLRHEPMLNGTALYGTVTAVVVGPLLKRIMQHIDNAADASLLGKKTDG